MGCCVSNDLSQELSIEELEEYNKLNADIEKILSNKDNINLENSEYLLELINKISIIIAKCEEIMRKVKLKRLDSKIINNAFENIQNKTNELNEYNKFLNNQVKENRTEILQKEYSSLKGSLLKTINDSETKYNIMKNNKDFVYYKKNIRRFSKRDRFNNQNNKLNEIFEYK